MSVGMLNASAFDASLHEIDRLSLAVAEIATAPVLTLVAYVPTYELPSTDELPPTGGALLAAHWVLLLFALWFLGESQRRRNLRRIVR